MLNDWHFVAKEDTTTETTTTLLILCIGTLSFNKQPTYNIPNLTCTKRNALEEAKDEWEGGSQQERERVLSVCVPLVEE